MGAPAGRVPDGALTLAEDGAGGWKEDAVMANFVLVHGAFQGGWVWKSVAAQLRGEGHEVYTPTLTGAGERMHLLDPSVNLGVYCHDVANLVYFEGLDDVILVGSSYAGMVIDAVAIKVRHKISRLVYLDAVVPEKGKSFVDLAGPDFELMLRASTVGWQVHPWPLEVFGIRCEEQKRWFSSRLVHFPLRAFDSVLPDVPPYGEIFRTYIHCTEHKNGFIKRTAARCKLAGWEYYELATGHCPMVTAPEDVAVMLNGLAAGGRSREALPVEMQSNVH
jgi:pimeloyl-ACP methyl ester carboxylesterase